MLGLTPLASLAGLIFAVLASEKSNTGYLPGAGKIFKANAILIIKAREIMIKNDLGFVIGYCGTIKF